MKRRPRQFLSVQALHQLAQSDFMLCHDTATGGNIVNAVARAYNSFGQLATDTQAPIGDAGDIYNGLDRFGRIIDHRWLSSPDNPANVSTCASTRSTTPSDLDRHQYGYNRASLRTYRANLVDDMKQTGGGKTTNLSAVCLIHPPKHPLTQRRSRPALSNSRLTSTP